MPPRLCILSGWLMLATPCASFAESDWLSIEITPSADGRVVTAGGTPFATYHTDAGGKPVVWPLIGPSGANLARNWPMAARGPHETDDHPHHRGMWIGYGDVNGYDFWRQPPAKGTTGNRGRIVHRRFVDSEVTEASDTLIAHNDWVTPSGETLCHEIRTLRFHATPTVRWVDCSFELHPVGRPLRLGDSKGGLFAVRVAGPVRLAAKLGGEVINNKGDLNEEAWGRRAAWVDYHGVLDDHHAGIAVFSHPSNFRARPRWHVRGYGLLAANPIGETDFPKVRGYRQGPRLVNMGTQLRQRYRVVLHLGDEQDADLAERYRQYSSK